MFVHPVRDHVLMLLKRLNVVSEVQNVFQMLVVDVSIYEMEIDVTKEYFSMS